MHNRACGFSGLSVEEQTAISEIVGIMNKHDLSSLQRLGVADMIQYMVRVNNTVFLNEEDLKKLNKEEKKEDAPGDI